MGGALDDVAFLASSKNRIALLEALTDGETHTRDELMAATDVSRPTLGRILDDLETRAWIEQRGQNCRITPLGAWVRGEFAALLETMDTAQTLREVVRWFPTEDVDFDVVRCLDDAEITFATGSDPTAPIRRACMQLRVGTRLRFLTTQATVWYFDVLREMVVHDGMTVEGVVTPDVYDALVTDAALATACRDLYDAGGVTLFVAEDLSHVVQIVDDSAGIGLVDGANAPRALIVSDDEAVLEWAEETFDSCRENATRRTPEEFSRRRETTPERREELLDTP